MAGYSGTPLVKKLGIKLAHKVVLLDAPGGFEAALIGLPADVKISRRLSARTKANIVLLFVNQQKLLAQRFEACARAIVADGAVWVAWPKRAAGVPTDLSEHSVRAVALAAGLVDNKVCAIDETWSGLRCVIPLKNRSR